MYTIHHTLFTNNLSRKTFATTLSATMASLQARSTKLMQTLHK